MPLRNLPGATLCRFQKGEYLIYQDEKIEFLYYLVQGRVHREMITSDGTVMTLAVHFAKKEEYIHSLVGILTLYNQFEPYNISNSSFIASTNCVCYRISLASYLAFEETHKEEILKQLLSFALYNYQRLFERYSSKNQRNAPALLCHFMLTQAFEKAGQLVFEQKTNNTEVGKILGIHAVNISKIKNVLIKEGALQQVTMRDYIILDEQYIKDVAANKIEIRYRHNK